MYRPRGTRTVVPEAVGDGGEFEAMAGACVGPRAWPSTASLPAFAFALEIDAVDAADGDDEVAGDGDGAEEGEDLGSSALFGDETNGTMRRGGV